MRRTGAEEDAQDRSRRGCAGPGEEEDAQDRRRRKRNRSSRSIRWRERGAHRADERSYSVMCAVEIPYISIANAHMPMIPAAALRLCMAAGNKQSNQDYDDGDDDWPAVRADSLARVVVVTEMAYQRRW